MAAELSPKVLVLEDDPDTRSNLCDILEMPGYEVETAENWAVPHGSRAVSSHSLARQLAR